MIMTQPVSFIAVVPARYASTRLPGKPLLDIAGKPMVVRVLERALASGAQAAWVATDDQRIADAVTAAGGKVVLTRADHSSGTDRLAEVASTLGLDDDVIVVNVQGDEPLIDPQLIMDVATLLRDNPDAAVATMAHPIHDAADFCNPSVVKVVCDRRGLALYFSRAPIPWARDDFAARGASPDTLLPEGLPVLRHIGLYAYRARFLHRYAQLEASPLERWEALEQLRVLWHGERIVVGVTPTAPAAGVDTPEDLQRVCKAFDQMK